MTGVDYDTSGDRECIVYWRHSSSWLPGCSADRKARLLLFACGSGDGISDGENDGYGDCGNL